MRKIVSLSVVLSLSILAWPAVAQEGGGNVAMIHCVQVQPGTEARFEEGVKKHMDWHRKQQDTWAWNSWTILTGPDTGGRCAGTFGHKWEDFDNPKVPMEADEADVQANFGAFIREHQGSFWTRLPDVSRPPDEPPAMNSVVFFYTRFGMEEEFNTLIGEFHKAIEKTNMPWRYDWFSLVSGGPAGSYALVLPVANFAAFNPTGKPFDEMLEEAYGEMAAKALLARWAEVVERSETELSQGRPDLSYIPGP